MQEHDDTTAMIDLATLLSENASSYSILSENECTTIGKVLVREGHQCLLEQFVAATTTATTTNFHWHADFCAVAAGQGNLSMLQWLRSKGCPWNTKTCMYAAAAGHVAVLAWARSQNCPWGDDAFDCAARSGHLPVLEWMAAQTTFPADWIRSKRARSYACKRGHRHVLQWLDSVAPRVSI